MQARRRERTAAQNLLADKPFVVVLVEVGFESGIRRVVRSRPFPGVANHLLTAVSALPLRECADGSDTPQAVLKKISATFIGPFIAPRKGLFRIRLRRKTRGLFPLSFSRQAFARPFGIRRGFEKTDVRDRLVEFVGYAMQTRKIANQPFTVALLPIQRSPPKLLSHSFPAG